MNNEVPEKTLEEQYDESFPATAFEQKKFNFTTKEYVRICSIDATGQIGLLTDMVILRKASETLINQYFNTIILPRVNIVPSPEIKLIYDLDNSFFKVYIPIKKEEAPKETKN